MMRSGSVSVQQQTAILRIRLVDKKVFKKFNLFLNKPVKEARLTIAKELGVDPDQYGLFFPPKDEQTGKWCKDDYPLSFYGYEGEKESKESLLMTNAAAMEYMEFKKRYRPIRMLVASTGTTIVTKAVTIDDTKFVVDVIKDILEQMENPSIISEDELFSMHEDEYELLTSDMTIREQGFLGECTMGLYKREYEKEEKGIYVKVPFAEGWIMRKRGGGVLKGLKNWNKRWYVLKKNKIMYYKSKSGVGQEPLGSIPIKNIVHLKHSIATDVPNKYEQFCFEIVTPARTFVMLAFSEHEFCSWMTHLENARRMFAHETIFLSPLQSTDQTNTPPSPNKTTNTNITTTEREQDKRKDIMIRGEQQRRMTLVILSEDDPVNINNTLERQRPQMLKRVNTSPALSIQQRMAHMQKAGSPRSISPSHSPRSISPSHSPRSLSPSHSPPPTRSPRAASPSRLPSPSPSSSVSSHPTPSSSSLSSSTVPASSSSAPSTSISTSTSSSPSSTNFSEASPPTAISSSASSSPSLSSSPSSGPSSNFLSATPPPADSSPLAISYDSVSRLDESENEDLKSSNGSPAPETVFVGDQLFSDGASIEHIGDEWLGSSYLHEVDLRDDFSRTGFALVKSSSYMDDLAGTANFAPSASPISSSLSLSSTLSLSPFPSPPSSVLSFMYSPAALSSPSISPSSSLLSITAVPARLELDDLLPKELKIKEEPKEEIKEEIKEEPKEEHKEEPKKEIEEPIKEVEQPKEEEPKVEEPKNEIEEPKLDLKEQQEPKLDIKEEEESKKVQIPKIEIISPVTPKKEKEEIIPTAAKSSPVKSELPFRPSSPTPSLPPRSSPSLLRFNSVQQHSVNNNNNNNNNANSPRLNNVNNTNIPSPRSPRPPAVIPIPEEEVTEEDNEFIKANEELKYLFYEPRTVKTRGDLLRAWANYVVQKGNRPPVNDWQAANKSQESHLSPRASQLISPRNTNKRERDLSVYLQLLHHHDSDTVSEKILKENSTTESRASALSKALSDLGIEGFSSEVFLKGDFKTQRELLQAIFENVGSESMNEFYYDVISRRNASCRFINSTMKDDPMVAGIVPFHPLYSLKVLSDGSILCHLINKVYPGTIDTNSINLIKRVLHPSGVPRLILLALNCAIALGSNSLKSLDPLEWADPHKKVRMLNELMWGVVEVCGLKYARTKENPALAPLQRTNEDKESFYSLSPIVVLIRWVNHHLRKHSLRTINNLNDDLEDGENYMILIDAIAHGKVPRKQWQITLGDNDWEKRASAILQAAKLLGCRMLITPRDICEAENVRLAPLFLAELLRVKNGFTQTEIDESTNARLTKSNKETQAEVAFSEIQPWLESLELGIDIDVSETFKDGTVFLKILDAIAPGAVDPKWLKVEPKSSRFKMVELANKTLEIASSLKINTTNIGGVDLVNGDIRPTVSLLNQFSRYGKTEVKPTSQSKIGIVSLPPSIVWANSQVAGQGKTTKLMSYKDQLVREGRFLIDLVSSLYPKVVNPSSVSPGQTDEEQEHNARYLLSLLWSLGISVSVLWQDIVSVRSQAIKRLMETLHNHYDEKTKQKV